MARTRVEYLGWPEQKPVREALRVFINRHGTQSAVAKKLGSRPQVVSRWLNGDERIPDWICETLGYRKAYIPIGGPVGVTVTENRP